MDEAEKAQANVRQVIPFLGVTDILKSVDYYVDGLGFTMTHKWEPEGRLRWCLLEIGGAALMLQEFYREGYHSNVPEGKLGQGVSLEFICEDAVAIYREVTSRGIQASEPQVGNAMWVTTLTDPDGYRIEFESPTDTPEEMKLSEVEG